MSSDTREIILQVANRLFVSQGYTATSTRQIAAEAGIGKATIYHHFPDKQAIVLALLDQNTGRTRQVLEAVKAETDPRRRIETAVEASLRFFYESADILQIVRREVPGGRTQFQSEYISFFKEHTTLLTEALQEGIEQGLFRPVNIAEASRVLLTMIQGTFALAHLSGERLEPPEKATVALMDIFFRGIEKQHHVD